MEDVSFIGAIALGVTFIVSAAGKLRDPRGFVLGVLDYQILPAQFAIAYGRVIPVVEFICGLCLLLGLLRTVAAALAAALLLSFLVGVGVNLSRGRTMDCHCSGSGSSEPLSWVTVARIVILLGCASAVLSQLSRPIVGLPASTVPSVMVAVGLLLGLYLLRAVPVQIRIRWVCCAGFCKYVCAECCCGSPGNGCSCTIRTTISCGGGNCAYYPEAQVG